MQTGAGVMRYLLRVDETGGWRYPIKSVSAREDNAGSGLRPTPAMTQQRAPAQNRPTAQLTYWPRAEPPSLDRHPTGAAGTR